MKTTFKQYLQEATMPPAESSDDLLKSIKDGKFTKDGSALILIDINCNNTGLTSLVGHPTGVRDFFIAKNKLTSLEGLPKTLQGGVYAQENKLITLKGAPEEVGDDFDCSRNFDLKSLKFMPKLIGGKFKCEDNHGITSLKDIHKYVTEIYKGYASFKDTPIKSHVLGLLRIKGLKKVDFVGLKKVNYLLGDYNEHQHNMETIINKYLPEGDIFACQQELIDAGLEEYAQL